MDKWEKREKHYNFIMHIQHYLQFLDFAKMYQGGRKKRFFANVIMLNGVFFIGMTVIAWFNYGLAWLAWNARISPLTP